MTPRAVVATPLGRVAALTFDCYGTLIDWERGLLVALREALAGVDASDEELLERFAEQEAAWESGPYLPYREILARSLAGIAEGYRVRPGEHALARFGASVAEWPAFADSAAALARLGERYRLGVVTNCDDDLFAASNRRLGVTFDWVVTAQQVGRYKPDPRPFEVALERIGLPRSQVVHVAQSLYHDHVPAKQLGLRTAWIDRRRGRRGSGATPPATAAPDLVVPDLATFAEVVLFPG